MSAKLGSHMSIAGGHDRAVNAAASFGFKCVQLFTKNNNQWKAPVLTDAHIAGFRSALINTGVIDPVAHNSYLINLASSDDTLWNQSIDAMTVEVERCQALGIAELVAHPGAHTGSGEEAGLGRIVLALDEIYRRTSGTCVTIDLETTAGQGSCLGCKFAHLGEILDRVKAPERLGVCVDTCHIFASGYSFGSLEEYDKTLDELARTVGLHWVRVWHLNDSLKKCGSRVDRHAGIGRGEMGLEPFRNILNDFRFAGIPMILETPKGIDLETGEELDALNLRVLRGLESSPQGSSRHSVDLIQI